MKSLLFFLFLTPCLTAQIHVKGMVVEKESGLPVPFAGIGLHNRSIGTLSIEDGHFSFYLNKQEANDSVRVMAIGYKVITIKLSEYLEQKEKKIELEKEANVLEEVVIESKKIKKEDGLIDPAGDAIENYRKFRAYIEWPRTYFFQDDKRIIITQAHLENNQFIIDRVLPEGKHEIAYSDFVKGLGFRG